MSLTSSQPTVPNSSQRQRRFTAREIARIKKAGSCEARASQRTTRSLRAKYKQELRYLLDAKKTRTNPKPTSNSGNLEFPASPLEGAERNGGDLGIHGFSLPETGSTEKAEENQPYVITNLEKVELRYKMARLVDAVVDKIEPENWEDYERLQKVARGLQLCGAKGIDNPLLLRNSNVDETTNEVLSSSHSVYGAFGCGRSNFCVACNLKKSSDYADNVKDVSIKWVKAKSDNQVLFCTVTFPSIANGKIEEIMDLRKKTMAKCKEGRQVKELRDGYGIEGFTTVVENQFSENKVHSHEHQLIYIKELLKPKTEAEIQTYELTMSNVMRNYVEKNLRSVVSKEREINPDAYAWIDLTKKDIIKKPEVIDGKIKGGVSVELARDVEAIARYLAKEVAMGLIKVGFGQDGISYSWAGLLKNLDILPWAKRVLDEYIGLQKHAHTFSWSRKNNKGFNRYVLEDLEVEEEIKTTYSSLIVGITSLAALEFFSNEAGKGNYLLANIMDNLKDDKDYDFEKASDFKIKKVDSDPVVQQYLREKADLEIKEYAKKMLEAKKRLKEERDKFSREELKQQIQQKMLNRQKRKIALKNPVPSTGRWRVWQHPLRGAEFA